ncbi:MAG TPA: hypothetical protein PLD27_06315 [bacterium]|nr:hypothetical protein [bacterium]HOL47574.1 hypothetical protein [bacterium]HPQ18836.1 hypothetical protein [bacterium]
MKKIYLLINKKVTGPYDEEILTKFELEKDLKIRYEDETEWLTIEEFLKRKDSVLLNEEEIEKRKNKIDYKLIRVKELKVKHKRSPIINAISKFYQRYDKLCLYFLVCLLGAAIVIILFYIHYYGKYKGVNF